MLLAAYDIGADGFFGTGDDGTFGAAKGNIGAITIGGTMSGTSIAAGIAPGLGLNFGDHDDSLVVSSSLQGAITSLTVKGALIGSANTAGEHYGVVAHGTIGAVRVGGVKLALPWHPAGQNIVIEPTWR
jgi:hypothetical protein